MSQFLPLPIDWPRNPKCRRLRRADPANEGRWIYLVVVAARANAGGDVRLDDGTPLTWEDLADEHDHNFEGWQSFGKLCHELDLISTSPEGVLTVVPWRSWHRAPSAMPEAERYRKEAQRERERRKKAELRYREIIEGPIEDSHQDDQGEIPEDIEDVPSDNEGSEPFESLVPSCPKLSQAVPSRPERSQDQIRSRSDQDQHEDSDQIKARKPAREPPSDPSTSLPPPPLLQSALPACANGNAFDLPALRERESVELENFWSAVGQIFEQLLKKKFRKADRALLETGKYRATWLELSEDLLVAYWTIAFACEEIGRRVRGGQKIGNLWAYVLKVCSDYHVWAEHEVKLYREAKDRGEVHKPRFRRVKDLVDALMEATL